MSVKRTTYSDFTEEGLKRSAERAVDGMSAFIPEGRFVYKGRDKILNEYKIAKHDIGEDMVHLPLARQGAAGHDPGASAQGRGGGVLVCSRRPALHGMNGHSPSPRLRAAL